MAITAVKGFKDVGPDESPIWRLVEETAARILRNFGYRRIRIPVVERTELFARSIGADTDIVEKEMFTFPDRNDELLTLRPEATAGIVRGLVEHKMTGDGRPLKVWFTGPMFRYEQPQKGRQRQFHQLDVELFNDSSAHADAEIIVLLDHFLSECGLSSVVMNVNSLGCPECRPGYKKDLQDYLRGVASQLCGDCQRRLDTNPLRVIDCKVETCAALAKDAPSIQDALCPDCRDHFTLVREDLDAAKVPYEVNPRLVRGLDYYSRTTFEAQTTELGAQNAVAGGGRYDYLAEAIGGPHIPATGWALGLERLVMLLADRVEAKPDRPDLFVAALGEGEVKAAAPLVHGLRKAGFAVEMDYAPGSLKSRMRRANKLGASLVLIVGAQELESGQAPLKDMETGDQETVSLADAGVLASVLAKRLSQEN